MVPRGQKSGIKSKATREKGKKCDVTHARTGFRQIGERELLTREPWFVRKTDNPEEPVSDHSLPRRPHPGERREPLAIQVSSVPTSAATDGSSWRFR